MKLLRIRKIMITVGVFSMVFVLFQNCSKVAFDTGVSKSSVDRANFPNGDVNDSTGVTITSPNPVDPSLINSNCAGGTVKEKVFTIDFLNPAVVCEWEEKGNLSIRNNYFQGRRRQTVDIALPESATFCDAEFEFSEQEFWYDDTFTLMLDANILVSSYNWDALLVEKNDFLQYDWEQVAGKLWDHQNKSEEYCVGKGSGLSACSFPKQHKTAPINLTIEPQLIKNAMANSGFINHSFHLVTTGDNDDTDCQHFDMQFNVKIKYVD